MTPIIAAALVWVAQRSVGVGGGSNAIVERLNPRHAHVVALSKPTEREQGQRYFQRHVPFPPSAAEIVLIDRSWYNRAGVDRVMGYCADDRYRRFLKDAPVFERLLVDDPWTVVRFDDQRRGRLNVIRHLVESVQYSQIADAPALLTPLEGASAKERFAGPVKPIRGWY